LEIEFIRELQNRLVEEIEFITSKRDYYIVLNLIQTLKTGCCEVATTGIAARLIGVSKATLRIREKKELIKPARVGKNRYYSRSDLDRLERIRDLLQKKRVGIEGAKLILETVCSCNVKKYPAEESESYPLIH
jgi:hypothetical protein